MRGKYTSGVNHIRVARNQPFDMPVPGCASQCTYLDTVNDYIIDCILEQVHLDRAAFQRLAAHISPWIRERSEVDLHQPGTRSRQGSIHRIQRTDAINFCEQGNLPLGLGKRKTPGTK